ncbi:hypothetical protein LIER_30116 [Lithospermum erythrorhizon]|uniref:Protein XRI1 n=1 Tax=Lithospermum erythrorhizon TaxID=34254 RepID=A0AAV3RLN1_LITER
MACNNDEELWGYAFGDNTEINMSKCILNVGGENEGFHFGFDDETTPVKDCVDLAVNDINSYTKIKEGVMEESPSQVKRRRTLQFESEVLDAPFCNEVMPQEFLRSQDSDSIEGAVSELSQWVSSFTENTFEALDLSSEEWVAECFNDTEMYLNFDEIDTSGTSVCQVAELNIPSSNEANVVQDQPVRRRQNVIFKGRKSFMQAPSKSTASVVYPFDFIKPCGIRGDITLKDINQKIHTPPTKSKSTDDDHSVHYPKSAFSGKPVVGKTKICTEGGKGSITIMRTKG